MCLSFFLILQSPVYLPVNFIKMDTTEEKEIKRHILGKPLTAIEFYNLNRNYLVPDENHIWIIDGGIELCFGSDVFSFAWSDTNQFYMHCREKIGTLTGEMKTAPLGATEIEGIRELIGKKITGAEIVWNWYSDMDENYEPTDVMHYMPMGIDLLFDNGSRLQLAAIKYALDPATVSVIDPTYDSEGELLITLDHLLEIRKEITEEE